MKQLKTASDNIMKHIETLAKFCMKKTKRFAFFHETSPSCAEQVHGVAHDQVGHGKGHMRLAWRNDSCHGNIVSEKERSGPGSGAGSGASQVMGKQEELRK